MLYFAVITYRRMPTPDSADRTERTGTTNDVVSKLEEEQRHLRKNLRRLAAFLTVGVIFMLLGIGFNLWHIYRFLTLTGPVTRGQILDLVLSVTQIVFTVAILVSMQSHRILSDRILEVQKFFSERHLEHLKDRLERR